jgi:hypothetical protein
MSPNGFSKPLHLFAYRVFSGDWSYIAFTPLKFPNLFVYPHGVIA